MISLLKLAPGIWKVVNFLTDLVQKKLMCLVRYVININTIFSICFYIN